MISSLKPRTHDLLRLRTVRSLAFERPPPDWVARALERSPWVVVRRGRAGAGIVPVGIRGERRGERWTALVNLVDVLEHRAPEELTSPTPRSTGRDAPVFEALSRVASLLERSRLPWGPVGSVGFELATGASVTTPGSDLDLVLRRTHRLSPPEAAQLHRALALCGSPTRVDVLLETPSGGVALAELASAPPRILVRTDDGPRLVADPWLAPPMTP